MLTMNILYWACFIYLVAMSIAAFYRAVKDGIKNYSTLGEKLGRLAGIITVAGLLVGIIYFYLH